MNYGIMNLGGRQNLTSVLQGGNVRHTFSRPPFQEGCWHVTQSSPMRQTHLDGKSGARMEETGTQERHFLMQLRLW